MTQKEGEIEGSKGYPHIHGHENATRHAEPDFTLSDSPAEPLASPVAETAAVPEPAHPWEDPDEDLWQSPYTQYDDGSYTAEPEEDDRLIPEDAVEVVLAPPVEPDPVPVPARPASFDCLPSFLRAPIKRQTALAAAATTYAAIFATG